MTNDEVQAFGFGAFLSAVVVMLTMAFVITTKYVPQGEVIKHGAAYYHPETGEFTWREKTGGGGE